MNSWRSFKVRYESELWKNLNCFLEAENFHVEISQLQKIFWTSAERFQNFERMNMSELGGRRFRTMDHDKTQIFKGLHRSVGPSSNSVTISVMSLRVGCCCPWSPGHRSARIQWSLFFVTLAEFDLFIPNYKFRKFKRCLWHKWWKILLDESSCPFGQFTCSNSVQNHFFKMTHFPSSLYSLQL